MARKPKAIEPQEAANMLAQPLVGHTDQQAALRSAIEAERLHHGWLLHGPQGIGKARFAAQLSAFLIADKARHSGELLDLDLNHPDARLLAQGAHPDAHTIDRFSKLDGKKPPRQIPVANVRTTLQKLQSTAAYGGWRTLVLDSVDELNAEGANALLKPLEEPPHSTLVVLIAHSLSAVLPTIRSRCRQLAFGPLDDENLIRWAQHSASDTTLAGLCSGRPGLLAQLAQRPQTAELFSTFCTLGANPRSAHADRLTFAAATNALDQESRALLLGLMDDWLSRRVRGLPEPVGFTTPDIALSASAKNTLAIFWSAQTDAIAVRQAINLDLNERMMALFQCLDAVYSQSVPT
jgi:DNA polymerase-3 subunit delta'